MNSNETRLRYSQGLRITAAALLVLGTGMVFAGDEAEEAIVERGPAVKTAEVKVSDDVKSAMTEIRERGKSKATDADAAMAPRGGNSEWCSASGQNSQARPTESGSCTPSMQVFEFAPPNYFETPISTSNVNVISIAQYFELGFIRTQSEFDSFMQFCWIPSATPGSGSCSSGGSGACPYDANAAVSCQSMAGFYQ